MSEFSKKQRDELAEMVDPPLAKISARFGDERLLLAKIFETCQPATTKAGAVDLEETLRKLGRAIRVGRVE